MWPNPHETADLVTFIEEILKVGLSPSEIVFLVCFIDSHSKMTKYAFLFHLKNSFRSEDIEFFVLTFWSCKKNDLIRKARLILKVMASQPG